MKNSDSSQINLKVVSSILAVMVVVVSLFTMALARVSEADPKKKGGPGPEKQEISQIKQIGIGIAIYITDYDDVLPPGVGNFQGEPQGYFMLISPYLRNFEVFQSPYDKVSESVAFMQNKTGRVSFGVNAYVMPHYLEAIPLNVNEIEAPEKVISVISAPHFSALKNQIGLLPPEPCALWNRVGQTSYVTKYPNNWMNIGNMAGIKANNLSFNSTKPLSELLKNKETFVSWSGDQTTIAVIDGGARRVPNHKLLTSVRANKDENQWDPYRLGCAP